MKKLFTCKKFLCKWYNALLCFQFLLLVVCTLISICIQSLFFYIGELITENEYLGMGLDIITYGLMAISAMSILDVADLFPSAKAPTKGLICISLMWLFTFIAYISIIATYLWWVLLLSLVIFIFCGIILENMGAHIGILFIRMCIMLIYTIGTYFAMSINDLEPAIDTFGITWLLCVTALIWMYSSFRECFKTTN